MMNVLRLREYRERSKMSQRDVSKVMKIQQASYWAWEKEYHPQVRCKSLDYAKYSVARQTIFLVSKISIKHQCLS